jgi:hypothetical protein
LTSVNFRGAGMCDGAVMSQHIPCTLQYVEEGASIAEEYQTVIGAVGRAGALISNGVGNDYAIFVGNQLLMNHSAVLESLRITRH